MTVLLTSITSDGDGQRDWLDVHWVGVEYKLIKRQPYDEWIVGWPNEWMREWVIGRMNERMNEWGKNWIECEDAVSSVTYVNCANWSTYSSFRIEW